MNWNNFQTYNDAPTKAFETLCNQLFENWCSVEYENKIDSFHVVNGAGGDGGVESYAVLSNGKIIGLQAKWFRDSITSNQMGQIKSSIKTALKVRPQITRYIVCIPRDLASLTAKADNSEDARWEEMKSAVLKDYPNLTLDLWDETRLTRELQKDCSAGIFKFWFERTEISEESVKFSFEKSKKSWLSTKYVPELNSFGTIHSLISDYLGDIEERERLKGLFAGMSNLCNEFYSTSDELIDVCGENDPQMVSLLNETKSQIQAMLCEIQKIQSWIENESVFELSFSKESFWIDFGGIAARLKESKEKYSHYFHFSAVLKVLQSLDKVRIHPTLDQIKRANDRRSLVFLGEPGTGKTHGVAAETEKLLEERYHIPILIQARDVTASDTWKDILISGLGLAASWSEEEIWQGLSSLVGRRKFHILDSLKHVSVLPKVLIVVDGVDESSPHDKWIERVQETRTIVQNYPSLRFCFMSRPYVFKDKDTGGQIINIGVSGDVATYKLFETYTKFYDVDVSASGWVKYALTTPLALKLFCEINKGKTIAYHSGVDVSIAALLKEKIKMLETEYCKQDSAATVSDQYIFRSILLLANLFGSEARLERNQIISTVTQALSIDSVRAQKLIGYLENYGILRLCCEHGSGLLSPDIYFCYPGIQGYFDYASALMLIDEHKAPQNIDFEKCKTLPRNAFYILAIISIQNFSYLITNNNSIDVAVNSSFKQDLLFFALRHTKATDAEKYKPKLLELMSINAETLKTITNNIILPLARDPAHALGAVLLDEFLLGFASPAQRDLLWSVPDYLQNSEGEKWCSTSELVLNQDSYSLTDVDTGDGLPTVYAWALSSVDNAKRQTYRIALMKWARQVPNEFYKLFLKFSSVNDPQIRSDIFSILMSVLFEDENTELLQTATKWLMANVLTPDKIEENRDISIRYYSTSIIRKALSLGIVNSKMATEYLPPFKPTSNNIVLSEEALAGTYMEGYGCITYDLGRYVLIDHITLGLPDHNKNVEKQYEKLIKNIAEEQPQFAGMSPNQLILSAAYGFITMCGWNEKEFHYYDVEGNKVYGVDCAISRSYWPKTHGTQSPVMTVCEKYVWQARNYISGFLADRLMHVDDDDNAYYVSDYGLLDDFLIPALEIGHIDPKSMLDRYPWHIPEKDVVIISGKPNSRDDVIDFVQMSPDIAWKSWVQLDNSERLYSINGDRLIALSGFSCFEGPSGVETNLYINSIIVAEKDVARLMEAMNKDTTVSHGVTNPPDWKGGIHTRCYITPKEVCWMPWKKRYDSYFVDEFPDLRISSAVDDCTYNFLKYGDVSYQLPSAPIRELLEITNTDGYEFYDADKKVKAVNFSAGEDWQTQQRYLLVNHTLLNQMQAKGDVLVWIMREQRRESSKAREKFGDFFAEKDHSYIGFFKNDEFIITQISKDRNISNNIEDSYLKILECYQM